MTLDDFTPEERLLLPTLFDTDDGYCDNRPEAWALRRKLERMAPRTWWKDYWAMCPPVVEDWGQVTKA